MGTSKHWMGRLVRELEKQGCTSRPGPGGAWIIKTPAGRLISVHSSPRSIEGQMRNVKRDVERAGLTWPKGL